MFHSCQNNKKIKHLPEGCLHLIQKDKLSSYEELLEKDGQSLLIIETSCFRDASDKIWLVSRNCNWHFYTDNIKVEFQKKWRIEDTFCEYCHGPLSTSYQGPKNSEIVPVKINELISLNSSKREIRNCLPQNYPCRLRKQYISAAGFLPWCLAVFFIFKV